MTTDVAIQTPVELLERVVVGGDLSSLSAKERMSYYKAVCESVGLNFLTRPFEYITLNSKLTLYAKKDATDQLRTIHGVSIVPPLETKVMDGVYVVTAYAKNEKGRTDTSTGAVSVENLRGEARANAMMKAETKAKRRVTLSICGLGLLDETEVETIPDAVIGETTTTPPDQNEQDRTRLLEQITTDARYLGLMKSEMKSAWTQHVGNGVKEEHAPIGKLLSLAAMLAERVALKQKQQPQAASVPDEIPF